MSNDENQDGEPEKPIWLMGDKLYKTLKFIALVLIPAVSTLYFTLGNIWNFPAIEQIIGTFAALSTFLGVLLGLSTKAYNNTEARFVGHIVITKKPGESKKYSLEMKGDPRELDTMKEATFKVGPKVGL